MKFLKDFLNKQPTWKMDPNHKVEWKTDYSGNIISTLEKDLERSRRRQELLFARLLVNTGKVRNAVKRLFLLDTNDAYLEKAAELIEAEVESILIDAPENKELKGQLKNILMLGDNYDPDYDHDAYVAKAKKNSITG